ncbi:hypothetical protein DC366_12920 [Pelagivirga sediminicola]|uniref:Uncharacterized protein n=1 Tax=Pelagivirga sediminicola TaxID=2170575 RepID=A0A2T7G590_9RHOB|nr:hypothetical protein [Pelagivirga sediminicola]PVA09589.1 hypothetical protein DC366_12920 [Pelagivirga sediminicola]
MKRAAWIASAALLSALCIAVVLNDLPTLLGNPLAVDRSVILFGFLTMITVIVSLLSIAVPISAAIWLSAAIGTTSLQGVIIVLAVAIVGVSVFAAGDVSIPYSDHYAYALYTLVFAITFRRAPGGLRIWGGILAAFWISPFVFAWAPELVRASLIDYAPSRLNAYMAVFAQVPPPPQPTPLIPLLFAAMLVFSTAGAAHAARWLAVALGATALAYASIPAFGLFVFSPVQSFDVLRTGALSASGALMSVFLWAVLFIAPFAMTLLSVRLYRVSAPRPA